MNMRVWQWTAALVLASVSATASVQRRTVEYLQGEAVLAGALVWDTAHPGPRPGVLVVHQWRGLGDYEYKRAEMLARLGYAVFCADIYGKGVRPGTPQEAAQLSGTYKEDRPLLQARVRAALDEFRRHAVVDPTRIAAIGYCFGGTTVLELARSGAVLRGVVSFHGGLGTPSPAERGRVAARVLVLHGADDPFVPPAEVAAFEEEMRKAGVDWQLVSYGGAVHSFTDWNAGSDPTRGAAYEEKADRRSWEAMKVFFDEILK